MTKPYPDIFKELTPAKAWVLGLWYSDGCVSKSKAAWTSALSSNDLDVILKARSIIQDTSQPDRVKLLKFKREHRVSVYSVDFAHHLMTRGVMPRKSKTMLWPTWLTPELLPYFVRGLWDGDGSISLPGRYPYLQLTYTSGSEDFLEGMVWAISPVIGGLEPTIAWTGTSWQFHIYTTRAAKLLEWLYEGANARIRGDRKYAIYQKWLGVGKE